MIFDDIKRGKIFSTTSLVKVQSPARRTNEIEQKRQVKIGKIGRASQHAEGVIPPTWSSRAGSGSFYESIDCNSIILWIDTLSLSQDDNGNTIVTIILSCSCKSIHRTSSSSSGLRKKKSVKGQRHQSHRR